MFFALYLTLRIVYNLFSIIPRTLSIPKSGAVYGSVKGFYFIFFTVLFIPGLVFVYQAMYTGEMGAHWQALNEDYIGRLLLLIPNSAIVLMGQNVGLPAKAWLTLVLTGLHVSTTVIFYILYSNTNSVRWKEGFSFHRRTKKHKKHISSFQEVKIGRGWDIVDVEGLRTFERIPWKVLRRAQNVIFVSLAIFGGYLAFFILFVGMSSWYLLYLLLAAPLIILGAIVINLLLILSSEGLKFFRLIPKRSNETTSFFLKFIETRCFVAAWFIPIIIFTPRWIQVYFAYIHIVTIMMLFLIIFTGLILLLGYITVYRIKNAVSPVKGHTGLVFVLPIYSQPRDSSRILFALKKIAAGSVFLCAICYLFIMLLIFPPILLISPDYMLILIHVVIILSILTFMHASFKDNILAYLSNNRLRLKKSVKWAPFIVLISATAAEFAYLFSLSINAMG